MRCDDRMWQLWWPDLWTKVYTDTPTLLDFPYGNVLCESKRGGGIDRQSSQRGSIEVEICRWGGRGGGSIDTQLRENSESNCRSSLSWVSLPTYKFQPLQILSDLTVNRPSPFCKNTYHKKTDRCALWVYHDVLWVILSLVSHKFMLIVLPSLFCKIKDIWTLNNKYQVSVHILVESKYSKHFWNKHGRNN